MLQKFFFSPFSVLIFSALSLVFSIVLFPQKTEQQKEFSIAMVKTFVQQLKCSQEREGGNSPQKLQQGKFCRILPSGIGKMKFYVCITL